MPDVEIYVVAFKDTAFAKGTTLGQVLKGKYILLERNRNRKNMYAYSNTGDYLF